MRLDLKWLITVISKRIRESTKYRLEGINAPYLESISPSDIFQTTPPPAYAETDTPYGRFLSEVGLDAEKRLLVALTLLVHICPGLLETLNKDNGIQKGFPAELGLLKSTQFSGYLPSGLTYLYAAAGYNIEERIRLQAVFFEDNVFSQNGIVILEPHFKGEPSLSGRLFMEERWVEYFILGRTDLYGKGIKYATLSKVGG